MDDAYIFSEDVDNNDFGTRIRASNKLIGILLQRNRDSRSSPTRLTALFLLRLKLALAALRIANQEEPKVDLTGTLSLCDLTIYI
jgi:hypothetical protein